MTAVATDLLIQRGDACKGHLGVLASTVIYAGTLVYIDASTGYACDTDANGANKFFGISDSRYDNSAGGNGDIACSVYQEGKFKLTGSSLAQTDIGAKAYGIDNATFQKSATNATYIGVIREYISATVAMVELDTITDGHDIYTP